MFMKSLNYHYYSCNINNYYCFFFKNTFDKISILFVIIVIQSLIVFQHIVLKTNIVPEFIPFCECKCQ